MDLISFKNTLLQRKIQLESNLEELEKDAPLLKDVVFEAEGLSAAYHAETKSRIMVIKQSIQDMLKRINNSLEKVKKGTYGICDRCGHNINAERLLAIPVTILCINCVNLAS